MPSGFRRKAEDRTSAGSHHKRSGIRDGLRRCRRSSKQKSSQTNDKEGSHFRSRKTKCSRRQCRNHRGINRLSVSDRPTVFARIVLRPVKVLLLKDGRRKQFYSTQVDNGQDFSLYTFIQSRRDHPNNDFRSLMWT